MPKPQLLRNLAVAALLLGLIFLGANLYLDANSHPKLANLLFVLAILCNTAFALLAVLWSLISSWMHEPDRPPMPMPGPGANKKPRPPQPPAA